MKKNTADLILLCRSGEATGKGLEDARGTIGIFLLEKGLSHWGDDLVDSRFRTS